MSSPMMMLVSSSEAVRKMIGTFDVNRTFLQNSKPEPSGNDTSRTSRAYFPSAHSVSASPSVLAISSSNPCFLKAKESPLIRLIYFYFRFYRTLGYIHTPVLISKPTVYISFLRILFFLRKAYSIILVYFILVVMLIQVSAQPL